MSQKDIWKKYILAQTKILEHKSNPIGIDTSQPVKVEGYKLQLNIDQEIFKKVFKAEVERIFQIEDYDFANSYILANIENTAKITTEKLSELKELADISYIDFNENPIIEGEIKRKNEDIRQGLKSIIGELPTNYLFRNSGLIFLTLDEWNKCKKIDNLKFEKKIGAVFPIKTSISFLISTFYRNIDINQDGSKIEVAGELNQKIYDLFHNLFDLTKRSNCLIFEFNNAEVLKQKIEELELKGISFPKPKKHTLLFHFDNDFYEKHESDLKSEASRIKKALNKYFQGFEYTFTFSTQYSYNIKELNNGRNQLARNEELFWDKLFTEIHGEEFQISRTHQSLSFDFENEEELQIKLERVKAFSFIDIYDRGNEHKYKFNIKFETGLHELKSELNTQFPNLNTKLIANGEKLKFWQYYKSGNKPEILSRVYNQLNYIVDSERFNYNINDTFQEKYLCEENFELKVEQEEEKLSKLIREDFFFGNKKDKFYLGKLQKVDYPELTFIVDDEKLEEVKIKIALNKIKAIFPDLKGEKDKIKRLEDTVLKLDSIEKLPNENAKKFLYNSSEAKKIENIDYLLNNTSEEWKDFDNHLFSNSLNKSQKQAIFKSLYSEELAIIQGPPGTGKSTAIAEIIWQHIRKNQKERILLTSETNLAVDNAIDRLKNNQNNIVKPIRFGNDDKLESEGYFYSITAIENWVKGFEMKQNAVAHWINNISNRICFQEDTRIDSALDKWGKHLLKPTSDIKNIFADKYFEYANLIGATGSSIGKLNSEDKWTSFFRSYLNVFDKKIFKANNWKACNSVNITFDTIIMDEASKATPPELALPVLYGKKAIIVGDHRQLPPLIDGEEIKDLLISIGEKKLAQTLSNQEFEKSQFERLFENIDESIKGTFNTQYRMHPAINEVISQFYVPDGGLNCGLPIDESHHNSFTNWDSRFHGFNYENIITPETHVIWINVDTPEIKEGTSRVNFGEVDAIENILTIIKDCEGKKLFDQWIDSQPKKEEESQIGLISFYGKQINHINKMLKEKHNDIPIRLSTVDRFQGMERNIIIVSMVRSNKIATFQGQLPNDLYGEFGYPIQQSLGFAESPNRLNVALSRARRLLIIVGNSEHFCKKSIYENVYNSIKSSERGKVINAEDLQKIVAQNG